ncbi:EAL domain-containing response regulator [Pseudoalteromonas xiamenensis]|uniref:EAL domain-containing response regulator n=1 Tax=Pseudoalteromonas xiamenensis TaxID=882626 RepID=UPI0027E4BC05|nr:EAL domain-containing response regulator [Pseudoalteromonas xiamenensis]WMN61312.1 EAL domain-containing response regulator [Pseudoalteromonas xiamenensis]
MQNSETRIIVVDDSPAILLVMQAIMTELDVTNATMCNSAIDALALIKKRPLGYDAVFTDLNMPEMDGMEFIRQLGECKFQGGIVIISEMDSKIIELAANLARFHSTHLLGNISKPVQLSEVSRVLEKLKLFIEPVEQANQPITEDLLLDAISKNEITPFYQPKINRATKRITSVEVLARIVSNETGQLILPDRFIGVAEDLDLINLITFQLFEKATEDFQEIRQTLHGEVKLAFNLSPLQLDDYGCPDKLALILELNHLKPENIILEITEHQPLNRPLQLETLNRLRMRGFDISLDDYGTGFTNLSQLKTLPLNEIKLDRSLVSHIDTDRFSQVIVDGLVDIAQNEGIVLVAEGIERIEELNYLERYKNTLLMQGFLISRPKSKREFLRWALSWLRMINSDQ